ncbi:MAG: hypothetical protein A2Z91_02605 [Deltaproteobacteria bacterium GWA2_38_16]|nr:MAG: hypothetical protein A2Z91_02605 [Deltaproteobacteria bacterium GWA2_38_16]OGQ02084.1 MAG: hypothetical protein A3D19_08900 [Deltaproteobacteria bacterium RIFCSPHIGHO2_02_FULL_38_15]OGQ32532.1 MAG: hypothetical protein A3A72_03035 [Deltaproteobacteria bacterium RIFCSPLOWO2_01_FULL_38_9]OGQ63061.1 MAG: hypothetical protein A3G92_05395 [Deltaproteobacteria bacterium RIFCSPLOWO2_12_FULL_38_8]
MLDTFLDFFITNFHVLTEMFLHLDLYLHKWILILGPGIYALLFVIVFCETGLVVTPFLPGDSLLFALGTFLQLKTGNLHFFWIATTLIVAAVLGDFVNYMIGYHVGPKIFKSKTSRWFNEKHLLSTRAFYERHGKKTIILARFLPIFRTFAPFVAGIGKMEYKSFCVFNIVGAIAWVSLFLALGFYFGAIPIVKENFEFVIVGIIFISFLPIIIRTINGYLASKH